jgi:hypothetical protein
MTTGTRRRCRQPFCPVYFITITAKVPETEIVVHPYSGQAGAIGAPLCGLDGRSRR